MYRIRRMFQRADLPAYTVRTVETIEEARAHCQDPETSSATCKGAAGLAQLRKDGPWFDGFEVIK